jgi:hypothetical protein
MPSAGATKKIDSVTPIASWGPPNEKHGTEDAFGEVDPPQRTTGPTDQGRSYDLAPEKTLIVSLLFLQLSLSPLPAQIYRELP